MSNNHPEKTMLVHPFEEAGLGQAPFVCTGYSRETYQSCQGAPVQPGASCDFCGTGIMDVCLVRSADGRTFKVGTDCVRRVYAEFDAEIPPAFRRAIADMQREKREAKRVAAWERLKARMEKARTALAADSHLFTTAPHPSPYFAGQGRTLRDYYEWALSHGSQAGRAEVCRAIEKATEGA